jgi:hypothetical protein
MVHRSAKPHQTLRSIRMKFDTLRWSRDWSRFKFFSILRPEKNMEIKSHTASASILGFSARTFLIMSSRSVCRPSRITLRTSRGKHSNSRIELTAKQPRCEPSQQLSSHGPTAEKHWAACFYGTLQSPHVICVLSQAVNIPSAPPTSSRSRTAASPTTGISKII